MFLIDMKHFTLHHYQRKMEQEKEELKSYIENDSKTMKEKLDKVRLFINPKNSLLIVSNCHFIQIRSYRKKKHYRRE